jgi:hypothetical protein
LLKTASILETAIGFIKFYFIPKKLKDLPRKKFQIVKLSIPQTTHRNPIFPIVVASVYIAIIAGQVANPSWVRIQHQVHVIGNVL